MRKLKWITRVPLTIKEALHKIVEIKSDEWIDSNRAGLKIANRSSNYGGVEQRWLITLSEARKKASIEQIDNQVEKYKQQVEVKLSKLSRQEFACVPDAADAAEKLSKSLKYYELKDIKYLEKINYEQAGRPGKIASSNQVKYKIAAKLEIKIAVVEEEKIRAGRFIVATNVLDEKELSDNDTLSEYKEQQCNERGFRFLKDPLFFTSSVFVKKPQRVEAIAMVMALCLLVYTLAQRKLRQALESRGGEGIKNQVGKLTNRPTMRWVFQVFQAIHLLTSNGHSSRNKLN